ncbi:GTP-binding protein [Maribellus sp. YY47]|uniref:CobW family GTP-binding protein n=1 Tax=Maribellus sp. YY47 TaxID=2929486 RepID=UPI0020011F7D|nr:GTP-binding protein [Maribellus sp. YY47]MCK3684321.1 GTP-binding protein [Maribellus sp. YY47]
MKRDTKIPVTVITGFLGAGKTTFINQLLQKYPERKFALVENEFGDVAIDTKLIKGVDASQMFELKQGCICCTITDEYELVLQELADRFPDVEHLLIETTGVADPAPVIQPFFSDERLKEIYAFNGTICLVDALHFDEIPEKEISLKQLAVADLILINKSNELTKGQHEAFLKEIGKLNPFARMIPTAYGNANDVELDKVMQKIRTAFDFVHFPSVHQHIETKLMEFGTPIPKEEFLRWFSYLMDVNKRLIYRTKGVLYFEDEPFEYILQGVGGNFELTEGDLVIEPGESKIVFIGKLSDVQFN